MKIYAFHLLNDYSGSPKVLGQLLKAWAKEPNLEVTLVTCDGREGFLSGIDGVAYQYFWYRWASNPLLRLFNLTLSQLLLFVKMFFQVRKGDVVYINTVLPFGAAFLGRLRGCRVIYHVHETTMKPAGLKWFLFEVARWAANDVIYVSHYLQKQEPFKSAKNHVLYNSVEDEFWRKAQTNLAVSERPQNVLMVCSLKDYKGVREYVKLSQDNPQFNFQLVLNASQSEMDVYFKELGVPDNLRLFATQTNLHPFYQWADVLLNLSRPDTWVETFGLTVVEGMAYGLPAIVPPVGGITELVEDGINGFRVDARDTTLLNQKLNELFLDPEQYKLMSKAASLKVLDFTESKQIEGSVKLFQ